MKMLPIGSDKNVQIFQASTADTDLQLLPEEFHKMPPTGKQQAAFTVYLEKKKNVAQVLMLIW